MNLSLSEQLIHATVRLSCTSAGGAQTSGTGFWFNFCLEEDGKHIPALVTNKHVVAGTTENIFYLTLKDGAGYRPKFGSHVPVTIKGGAGRWIMHPDPEVDLCIFLVGPLFNEYRARGVVPFFVSLDFKVVPDRGLVEGLTAMEDIVMVGYPIGIWDQTNNLPILRRGITATPYARDYNGKSEFVIDAACFPGSSGSPVCLINQGSFPDRDGNVHIGNRFALLGVLYAGPQHTSQGEIIVEEIPSATRPVPISRIPSNLGYCIKSERLRDFEPILHKMSGKSAAK